ncbi:MAG: hypothetical protein AB8B86_12810 [Pseudomonadales bacterium]
MKRIAILLFSLLPLAANAETAIGGGVSTLGLNVSVAQSLTDNLSVRLAFNTASYDFDGNTDGIEYDYGFDLSSISALADWHVFETNFRITVGGISNGNEIDASSKDLAGTVQVGDQTFSSTDVGRLEGKIDFDSLAPYLGIGWGRAANRGWAFLVDIGVAMQGSGEAELRSVGGTLSNNPTLLAEIEREEAELEADIEDYDLYPVIGVQVFYTF